MKEISVSIIYHTDDSKGHIEQIMDCQSKYVPYDMEINEVQFEKEWVIGKTKITFIGVEK